jgi:integrase
MAVLWTIAVYSGCRLGELLALQWGDADLEQGTITIRRTLERVDGTTPVYGEPKTNRSRRTVALPTVAMDGLRRWRARQNEERLAVGADFAGYGLVFSTELGTPLSGRNAHRLFKLALARAGLPSTVRVHDLRHFAATLMLSAGVHPKIASERLGHSTVGITLDLYSHAVQGLDVDAAERMARAMELAH